MKQVYALDEAILKLFCEETSAYVPEEYFRIRRLEFELMRMLHPSFFATPYVNALEIGCGIGFKAVLMSRFADHIDAIDIDEPYHGFCLNQRSVDIAQKAYRKTGRENIVFSSADYIDFMGGRPETYDLVYSDYLLEHISNLAELYAGMYRCMKPGGRMIHVVPNTHDALIQLARENLQPTLRGVLRVIKGMLTSWRNGLKRRPRLKPFGYFIPITHSEHLSDFTEQFETYRLESYVFPMMEAGLTITAITPLREHTYAVFAEKRH